MENYYFLVQNSFILGNPYVGVVKNVKTYIAYPADNHENYLHDTRHSVATP